MPQRKLTRAKVGRDDEGAQIRGGFFRRLFSEIRLPLLFSIFFSIPAFIFGIVAFWENHREGFEASSAYLNKQVVTKSGYGIHLTVTNNGNPPVVIDRAVLQLEHSRHNLPIYSYLANANTINNYSADPSQINSEKRTLPIAIEPHTAQTFVLLAHPETLNNGRIQPSIYRVEQERFCQFIRQGTPRPTLRLHLTWSGWVFGGPFEGAPESEPVEVRIAGQKSAGPSWLARAIGSVDGPTAIEVRHRLAEPAQNDVATLRLYGPEGSEQITTIDRPLLGHQPSRFPLPSLEDGVYSFALIVDGDAVAGGRLPIPLPSPGYELIRSRPLGFCAIPRVRRALAVRIGADQPQP